MHSREGRRSGQRREARSQRTLASSLRRPSPAPHHVPGDWLPAPPDGTAPNTTPRGARRGRGKHPGGRGAGSVKASVPGARRCPGKGRGQVLLGHARPALRVREQVGAGPRGPRPALLPARRPLGSRQHLGEVSGAHPSRAAVPGCPLSGSRRREAPAQVARRCRCPALGGTRSSRSRSFPAGPGPGPDDARPAPRATALCPAPHAPPPPLRPQT